MRRHSDEIRQKAKELYASGLSCREIARRLKLSPDTVWRWRKEENWDAERERVLSSKEELRRKIEELASLPNPNEAQARTLDKLTKALERLERLERKKEKKPREKNPPALSLEVVGNLYEKWLDKLYEHQREWVLDKSRFRILLKSRQTGFSMTTGGEVLMGAMGYRPHLGTDKLHPEDQVVISASKDQSDIVRRYCERWAEELGIELVQDKNALIAPGGKRIWFLPCNWRTIQGYSGDLFLDEFAWHPRNERIYSVAAPIVTVGKKRLTILSTPFVPYDKFGEIWFNENEFSRFKRHKISIHDAIRAGMEIDLEEVRSLFDEETFKMMYECEFFSDEGSLLTYAEIQEATIEEDGSPVEYRSVPCGECEAGFDVGRMKDLSVLAVVCRDKDLVRLVHLEVMQRKEFAVQKETVRELVLIYDVKVLRVDQTGIGMGLAEELRKTLGPRVKPVWFTRENKVDMALSLKKLFEERRIKIPNDRTLISHLLAVKRKATESGVTFEAHRTQEVGHADCFWALALACWEFAGRKKARLRRVEIL